MIIGIVYMAWRYRRELGNTPRLAIVTLIAVCVQGPFGAWTVTHQLMPIVVTSHLLGRMLLLALMTWLAARETTHTPIGAPDARWPTWMAGGRWLLLVHLG